MPFTEEEKREILGGIPEEVQARAREKDPDAVREVKAAILRWKSLGSVPELEGIDAALGLARKGDFNWDQISGLIDAGRLGDDVVKFARGEGYGLEQSVTGGRFINVGRRSVTGTAAEGIFDRFVSGVTAIGEAPFRLLGNDPTGMSRDDFYRQVLKQPEGDWMRKGVEGLILEHLEKRRETAGDAYGKFGEEADLAGAGKAEALAKAGGLERPNPGRWFPESFVRTEDGEYRGDREELARYREVLEKHDPYTWEAAKDLRGRERVEFFYGLKEYDGEMMGRLEALEAQKRTHLHDPEVYDWYLRRGMGEMPEMRIGEAVKAGFQLVGDMVLGLTGSGDGKGILQEGVEAIDPRDGFAQGRQARDLVGAGFRAMGSDYLMMMDNAGGYFLDVAGELWGAGDTPEGREAVRRAKVERNRQFQLRALANQATYSAAAHDLASEWSKNPKQTQRNLLASTIALDPTTYVGGFGVGKKLGEKTVKGAVGVLEGSALKTAKNGADDAAKAVSEAQGNLVKAMGEGGGKGVPEARRAYDQAVGASEAAFAKLEDASRELSRKQGEILEGGMERMSGHALAALGKAGEQAMELVDRTIRRGVDAVMPNVDEGVKQTAVHGTKVAALGSAGFFASGDPAGSLGAGVVMGTPLGRGIARDMQKVGAYVAMGGRLQPMHRALRETFEIGDKVIDPVSPVSRGILAAWEIPYAAGRIPGVGAALKAPGRALRAVTSAEGLEGMATQAVVGFLGSGGTWEGAVTGGSVGAGLMGAAGAAGGFLPVGKQEDAMRLAATNARHFRKMLEGTATGEEFAKLGFEEQKMVAWAMGGFPDTALRIEREPGSAPAKFVESRREIVINLARPEWKGAFARQVMKHEHAHYVARHVGVREKVLGELLGDTVSRRAGIFAKTDGDGKARYRLEAGTLRKIAESEKTAEQVAKDLGLSVEAVRTEGRVLSVEDRRRDDVYLETTEEFDGMVGRYLERLEKNDPDAAGSFVGMSRRQVQEYIAEEIFAEHGAAQFGEYSPEYVETFRRGRTGLAKGLDAVLGSERLSGRAAGVVGRLGGLLGRSGRVESAIFGEMPGVEAFGRIFEAYNHSRSLGEGLVLEEGNSGMGAVLDPAEWEAGRMDASTENLKAWAASGMLDIDPATGRPYGVDLGKDGEWIVRDPKRIRRTAKEAEAEAREFGAAAREWLEENSVPPRSPEDVREAVERELPPETEYQRKALEAVKEVLDSGSKEKVVEAIRVQRAGTTKTSVHQYLEGLEREISQLMPDDDVVAPRRTIDGRTLVAGRYLPEGLLGFLEGSGRFNPHQLANLRMLNGFLRDSLHAHPVTVMYQAATRAGRARPIAASERTVYVTGFEVTQQGNLIYRVWNLDKAMGNGERRLGSRVGKQLYPNRDAGQFRQDVFVYFNNYAKKLPGATGIGRQKRDFIRKVLGLGEPRAGNGGGVVNPYSWEVAALGDARDAALNSYRIDRTNWIDLGNPRLRRPLEGALDSREVAERPGAYQLIRANYAPGSGLSGGGESVPAGRGESGEWGVEGGDQKSEVRGRRSEIEVPDGEGVWHPGVLEVEDVVQKISTRNPKGVGRKEDPLEADLVVDLATIAADPKMLHSHAFAVLEYPGVKRGSRSPGKIVGEFMDFVVENLLWLHDQVPEEIRGRSKLWYEGARKIVERWEGEFGVERQGIAAALAALSPQKDWFMNVNLAQRVLDIFVNRGEHRFDEAMGAKFRELFAGKSEAAKVAVENRLGALMGKTLEELDVGLAATFVRVYDETYHAREYEVVSPEGDFVGLARAQGGETKRVAWGSGTEIGKAIQVLREPSKANISGAMGDAHKIRNFYNNLLLPQADELSVTIDTHAIAAALLRPLAGSDLEVLNNFGAKPKGAKRGVKNSSLTGIQGTYGIYAEAYRRAARERGVLPREMQSITWEAIRGLYPAKWKSKKNKALIDELWMLYENGETQADETRNAILQRRGSVLPPEWAG